MDKLPQDLAKRSTSASPELADMAWDSAMPTAQQQKTQHKARAARSTLGPPWAVRPTKHNLHAGGRQSGVAVTQPNKRGSTRHAWFDYFSNDYLFESIFL